MGTTTRPATAELAKKLEALEFAIEVTENQLLIVGADDYVTTQAVNYFMEHYLSDTPGGDIAQLPIGLLHKGKIEATLDAVIGSAQEIPYTLKKLGSLPHDVQGGVITEDAAYMAYTVVLRDTEYVLHTLYYHPEQETFISCSSTGRLAFFDKDLKFKEKNILSRLPSGLMDQSTFATEKYIFYLFASASSDKYNAIWIYDYDGKLVNSVSFPELVNYEAENISIIGDTIYVAAINWSPNRKVKDLCEVFEIQLSLK